VDKRQCEAHFQGMKPFPARSPAEKVGGLVYFGRMIDKIRAHARGELPPEYLERLGSGFDGRSDEEIWQWAWERGRKPSEEDMGTWNEFLRKCGWKDALTPTLERRKKESGLQERADIETMFQYIDADEGRELRP
jgi:gluconokinase